MALSIKDASGVALLIVVSVQTEISLTSNRLPLNIHGHFEWKGILISLFLYKQQQQVKHLLKYLGPVSATCSSACIIWVFSVVLFTLKKHRPDATETCIEKLNFCNMSLHDVTHSCCHIHLFHSL